MHEETKLQELVERARLYASVSSLMRNERDAEVFRDAADELEKKKTVLGTDAVSMTLEVAAWRYAIMAQTAKEIAAVLRRYIAPRTGK